MNNQFKPQASQATTAPKSSDKGGAVRTQNTSSQSPDTGGFSKDQSQGRTGKQGMNPSSASQRINKTSEEKDTE